MAAMAVIGALTLAGCAVETGFPAVHDMPTPRAETTLTPDQVKEATDSLISQREHLSTEAQGSPQPVQTAATPAPPAPPATAAQQKRPATPAKATAAASSDDATGATAIGAYAKP
jgi:hypothetical protein